jgi:hypothetical protein
VPLRRADDRSARQHLGAKLAHRWPMVMNQRRPNWTIGLRQPAPSLSGNELPWQSVRTVRPPQAESVPGRRGAPRHARRRAHPHRPQANEDPTPSRPRWNERAYSWHPPLISYSALDYALPADSLSQRDLRPFSSTIGCQAGARLSFHRHRHWRDVDDSSDSLLLELFAIHFERLSRTWRNLRRGHALPVPRRVGVNLSKP